MIVSHREDFLSAAREMAAVWEIIPLFAAGVAVMDEDQFLKVALRAKRLLTTRLSQMVPPPPSPFR